MGGICFQSLSTATVVKFKRFQFRVNNLEYGGQKTLPSLLSTGWFRDQFKLDFTYTTYKLKLIEGLMVD